MARQIFRQAALERLSSPEQIDRLMPLTSPRSWIALAAVGLLIVGALAWGLFGTLDTTVEGQGVLMRQGGITSVPVPCTGVVSSILVHAGQTVESGQELARVAPSPPGSGKLVSVVSPCSGRVLQRVAREGTRVEPGATLLLLERLDQPLRARLFLPTAEGYQVQPGMHVHVVPMHLHASEHGYLIGQVLAAERFPTTQADMVQRLHNEELVRQLAAQGPCLEVLVELETDPHTASGYRWSSPKGAPLELYSGTPCTGSIVLGQKRLIQLVFPGLGGS